MGVRERLTPQMAAYEEKFADSGDIRWLPYLMYFHPTNHASAVVNTDASGFRYSESQGRRFSVRDNDSRQPARLLAGSSTVFGIGASSDGWTLSSRLTEHDERGLPWLNFGGRSFNSAQELILLSLYRHTLPPIEEIVLFSGFNNLGLARLPSHIRQEHGAFFNCNEFFESLGTNRTKGLLQAGKKLFSGGAREEEPPSLEQQIAYAADLTLHHLLTWNAIAKDLDAKLTFVLQPLAGWVRPQGSKEEEALFAELDQLGRFTEVYGDILNKNACSQYAAALREGVEKLGARFINLSPILAETLAPEQWLFVDRIHFTDQGHDFVARQLLNIL
ncbi:SGNH/GDSL hydrolase family protein [Chromobacterium piscinae]|uniref:SGNH/GDSL hydrolase family protein n=2 Tax=Chromobacterium piscinae TaxID=686831 RepID=A0ABV0GZ25_9NEIS|nr:SGNH/GDSL hydrolase family protein [Chromobacterium piscinae]MCD5326614.1 hypothetical protein [Chromobacterium piscinae]NHQ83836.1 SGNH/GDSL hydrolase family protein [Chromobacterium vaccinii]